MALREGGGAGALRPAVASAQAQEGEGGSPRGASGIDEKERKGKVLVNVTNSADLRTVFAGAGSRTQSVLLGLRFHQAGEASKRETEMTAEMAVSVAESPGGSDSYNFSHMSRIITQSQNINRKTNPPKISPPLCIWEMLIFFLLPVESWKSIEAMCVY